MRSIYVCVEGGRDAVSKCVRVYATNRYAIT